MVPGQIDTGVTCAIKHLQMRDTSNNIVADGYLVMPQLDQNNWSRWLESSLIFTQVDLIAGNNYTIKIFSDDLAINMSSFSHYEKYTGNNGTGGKKPYNYVNITEVKFLSLTGQKK